MIATRTNYAMHMCIYLPLQVGSATRLVLLLIGGETATKLASAKIEPAAIPRMVAVTAQQDGRANFVINVLAQSSLFGHDSPIDLVNFVHSSMSDRLVWSRL